MISKIKHCCLHKPKLVFGLWCAFTLLIGFSGFLRGFRTVVPGPFSLQHLMENPGEVLAERGGIPYKDSIILILENQAANFPDESFSKAHENLYQFLKDLALDPARKDAKLFKKIQTAEHTILENEYFISKDKKNVLLIGDSDIKVYDSAGALTPIPKILAKWNEGFPEYKLHYLSIGTFSNEMFALIDSDLHHSLIYTIPITVIILIWAFGTIAAALIPLFIAGMSLISSLGISAHYSHMIGEINATASQLVVLLVLAIGIDYSLFMISRVREEVLKGLSYEAAIEKAYNSTGLAIFWSGVTVTISLFGLFIMQDTILTSMAVVSVFAVIVTLISCLTALPAILMILRGKIESGKVLARKKERSVFIGKCLALSTNRPVLMLLLSSAIVLSFSVFAFKLKLGTTVEPNLFPASMQSTKACKHLQKNFPDLSGTDFSVVMQGKNLSNIEEDGGLTGFVDGLNSAAKVSGPIKISWSEDKELLRYEFITSGSGNDPVNLNLIDHMHSKLIPDLKKENSIDAFISGTLPFVKDSNTRYSDRMLEVIALVLSLSFIFLLLAFRSILVPLKALALNTISTLSAFGILVLVFQSGYTRDINYGVIESFVPALLFSILFGLSMDYHVFLLSRIREYVASGMTTKQAVQNGIAATSLTITSAALIMVSVFIIIATLQLPIMKELGLGLAVAVFLDATVVRLVLLPSSMVLLGEWNWYLPPFLRKLPNFKFD